MTKAEAQAELDRWQTALATVADGTSYSIGGRSLTRADIADIRDQITYWRRTVKSLPDETAPDPADWTPGESTYITPNWSGY